MAINYQFRKFEKPPKFLFFENDACSTITIWAEIFFPFSISTLAILYGIYFIYQLCVFGRQTTVWDSNPRPIGHNRKHSPLCYKNEKSQICPKFIILQCCDRNPPFLWPMVAVAKRWREKVTNSRCNCTLGLLLLRAARLFSRRTS